MLAGRRPQRPACGTRPMRGCRGLGLSGAAASRPIAARSAPVPAATSACSAAAARTGVPPTPNSPIAARVTRSPSTVTPTTAPQIAKSPWRRATSSTANPLAPSQTGKRTPVRISPSSSEVCQVPWKKSAAAMSRLPPGPAASMVASSASATAGSSEAGSAWAIEPPTVPRLRIWKCPMWGSARATSRASAETVASCSAVDWRTRAPIRTCPFERSIVSSPATLLRSTRCPNVARRSDIIGTRLCPPASTLASSPCSASRPTASPTVVGAWYWNLLGFNACPLSRCISHGASSAIECRRPPMRPQPTL